jgi:hypothetical protein
MTERFEDFLRRREQASNDYIRGNAAALAAMLTEHDPAAAFKNPSGAITVEVTAVALSNPDVKPQSDLCAGDGNIEEFPADRACWPGVTLRAGEPGCYVGIAAKSDRPPDDYKSTVSVTVKGRCTSTALNPCGASELKASPPTPAHPVDVTWTTSRSGVCYRVASPDPDPFCA